MAIMEHHAEANPSSFDESQFLMSHDHDFMQHSAAHKDEMEQQSRREAYPPGNLSLVQLHSLDSAWPAQRSNTTSSGQPSPPSSVAQDGQRGRNSLGLLGSEFSQSNSASPQALNASDGHLAHAYMHTQPPHSYSLHDHAQHQTPHSLSSSFSRDSRAPPTDVNLNTPWYGASSVPHHLLQHSGTTLHRQQSSSSLSDTSTSSVYNDGASIDSHSQLDPTSPVRNTFTPLQSPMGLTHSISSLAGLAIGTPQQSVMQPNALEDYLNSCPDPAFSNDAHSYTGEGDQQLLSLTDGFHGFGNADIPTSAPTGASQLMAPPAGQSNRRRSTGVAHTLYTSQVRQLRQEMGGVDDATPMPLSHQKFTGQPSSSEVSDMASFNGAHTSAPSTISSEPIDTAHLTRMPMTPRNMQRSVQQHPTTMPPTYGQSNFHTSHAQNSMNLSPADDSSALGSSITDSGFSTAPRLNRMDSFDSFTSGSAISTPSSEAASIRTNSGTTSRSLEATIAEHEAKLAAAHAAAAANVSTPARLRNRAMHPQTPHSETAGDRTISPDSAASSMYGTPLSSGMARIASAPAHALQQQQMQMQQNGMPSTPVRNTASHELPHGYPGSQPFTPHHASSISAMPGYQTPQGQYYGHRIHELTMSAPQMVASRSMSSLPSPGLMTSPLSPMDARQQHAHGHHPIGADLNNVFGSPVPVMEDGQIRPPASGVARTGTPRNRGRNAAPPPLIVSSADKLHVCYCGKRFKRLEHLKRHNRVHTQERPHPCPAPGCNKWFGRTDNLTQHLKTHYRTLGRTSESLLQITQAAAAAKANGPEARGLTHTNNAGGNSQSIDDGGDLHQDARHDPHAAAAAAAARAVSKTNMKRRITLSNDMLGGPISLDINSELSSRSPSRSPNTQAMDQ